MNRSHIERRLLQASIAVAALVPVLGGIYGVITASAMLDGKMLDGAGHALSLDSHVRYLSGLLLGIGLTFWACIPQIETRTIVVRSLTVIVLIGGLARACSIYMDGWPSWPMVLALGMELVVTPLLCLWQGRVAGLSIK